MMDKTIPDSAEPRLDSFYPPFVAGIYLPHQGVVDYYNIVPIQYNSDAIDRILIEIWYCLWLHSLRVGPERPPFEFNSD